MIDIPSLAHGVAKPATPEDIAKEDDFFPLVSDEELILATDDGTDLVYNSGELGYTNPNLHRRIHDEAEVPIGSNYPFVHYRDDGTAYPQHSVIGVWDGINSYRTTTTYIHDEESTTCEIP